MSEEIKDDMTEHVVTNTVETVVEDVIDRQEEDLTVDTIAILDAVKELTTHVGTLTKTINAMKETHDKWVRAGKF